MAISTEEFLRLVPQLLVNYPCNVITDKITITDKGKVIEISFNQLPKMKLGALKLPQLKIDIKFHHSGTNDRVSFLRQFNQLFQRGGG